MASLKITRASGEVSVLKITPAIEYAFEKQFNNGIHKQSRDLERQGDIYWLAWECMRRAGLTIPLFGDEFLVELESVEVLDDEEPRKK